MRTPLGTLPTLDGKHIVGQGILDGAESDSDGFATYLDFNSP